MNNASHKGFTLVELIVVLVIIGVLAVSLVPRFFSAAGTSEYLYQDQLLNLLRRAQIQSMQCTVACTPPVVSLTNSAAVIDVANCNDSLTATTVCIAGRDAVSLSPAGDISFDSLGRPSCSAGSCTISVQGEARLNICIESEGYIHPC